MSKSTYCGLIDGLCKLTGLDNPEELYERAGLNIDGVEFVLAHGGSAHENSLILFCNFGVLPYDMQSKAMSRLMEANLQLFPPGGLRFGINPFQNEAILTGLVPMQELTAASLFNTLRTYAQRAKEWRDHYFLFLPTDPQTSASSAKTDSVKSGRPS